MAGLYMTQIRNKLIPVTASKLREHGLLIDRQTDKQRERQACRQIDEGERERERGRERGREGGEGRRDKNEMPLNIELCESVTEKDCWTWR